jgi:predicted nucleotidyltransferase
MALQEVGHHPEPVRLGYFGSYARGDWGVGSDLDLIAIVRDTDTPFERRALTWDLNALPIPAELVVYTQKEWEKLMREHSRFADTLSREAVWVYP